MVVLCDFCGIEFSPSEEYVSALFASVETVEGVKYPRTNRKDLHITSAPNLDVSCLIAEMGDPFKETNMMQVEIRRQTAAPKGV